MFGSVFGWLIGKTAGNSRLPDSVKHHRGHAAARRRARQHESRQVGSAAMAHVLRMPLFWISSIMFLSIGVATKDNAWLFIWIGTFTVLFFVGGSRVEAQERSDRPAPQLGVMRPDAGKEPASSDLPDADFDQPITVPEPDGSEPPKRG